MDTNPKPPSDLQLKLNAWILTLPERMQTRAPEHTAFQLGMGFERLARRQPELSDWIRNNPTLEQMLAHSPNNASRAAVLAIGCAVSGRSIDWVFPLVWGLAQRHFDPADRALWAAISTIKHALNTDEPFDPCERGFGEISKLSEIRLLSMFESEFYSTRDNPLLAFLLDVAGLPCSFSSLFGADIPDSECRPLFDTITLDEHVRSTTIDLNTAVESAALVNEFEPSGAAKKFGALFEFAHPPPEKKEVRDAIARFIRSWASEQWILHQPAIYDSVASILAVERPLGKIHWNDRSGDVGSCLGLSYGFLNFAQNPSEKSWFRMFLYLMCHLTLGKQSEEQKEEAISKFVEGTRAAVASALA